ncbi:MAG: peptidylprolyl isomerase [Lachnospira sp.]
MRKRYVLLSTIILCLGIIMNGCGKKAPTDSSSQSSELLSGKHHISIEVSNYGTIKAELDADAAPITVTNFINLANSGFYDGLTFHRVIDGFMIQGGDPEGNGTGGSTEKIKGEFSNNGIDNNISHTRGTISMARSSAYNSASSQFFIMQKDRTSLDGQYAAFGTVTDGMDIVDKICKDCTDTNQNGVITDKSKQPVITKVNVID